MKKIEGILFGLFLMLIGVAVGVNDISQKLDHLKACQAPRISFPIATPFDAHPHLTDQDLQGWYETYRRMYFGKDLPDAKVFWTDLPEGLMGQTNKTPEGNFEIRIDRKANPAQKEALMTLLHEMCHVDMWALEFDDHGKMWQFDMHRLADEDAFEDLW